MSLASYASGGDGGDSIGGSGGNGTARADGTNTGDVTVVTNARGGGTGETPSLTSLPLAAREVMPRRRRRERHGGAAMSRSMGLLMEGKEASALKAAAKAALPRRRRRARPQAAVA